MASKKGARKGPPVRFPTFKCKHGSKLSVSLVEINHQLSWLHGDRHHVRLMLPHALHSGAGARDRAARLGWIHTQRSTRRLYRLVESGRATIQKVTFSFSGGRWWVSIATRITQPIARPARKPVADMVGVDVGVKHLATLSRPVAGLTDDEGHVANPKVLAGRLNALRRLDRALARAERGSKNHKRLKQERARLHGAITQTRALHLHRLTREVAARFDLVAVENLHVAGMSRRHRRLGRSLADAALAGLRNQLAYKTVEHDHQMVVVSRWFPSSKTCSSCSTVKAKLELWERTFACQNCGLVIDRDRNAALSLEAEGRRMLAGLRPESRNGDPRPGRTTAPAVALVA
jgi:putative transposase